MATEARPDESAPSQHESSIKVTKRTNRTLYMSLIHHLIKPFGSLLIKQSQQHHPPGSPQLDVPKSVKKVCEIQERQVENIYLYDLIPKQHASRSKRLYYFAGGGWQSPPTGEHWAMIAEIAQQVPDTTVTLISYPLAPSSPAPTSFPAMMILYRTLLRQATEANEAVILAGDSAGGNIILALTLSALLEDPTSPYPTALMALSPSTDLTRSNPDIEKVAPHDPILRVPFIKSTAKAWCGEWDATDPRVSPLYADVSILAKRGVKVHGVTGGFDILGPDALKFREKCREAGVQGEWLEWDQQMHVFPLMWKYYLPEAMEAKDWICDVMRRS